MLLDDIKINKELGLFVRNSPAFNIIIFSNITVNQLQIPLELELRRHGVNASVIFADYDNFVQESVNKNNYDAAIYFWEACSLTKGFYYKSNLKERHELDDLISKINSEIKLSISNLNSVPIILFNSFNSLIFNNGYIEQNSFDYVCESLNKCIGDLNFKNFHLIDSNKLITSKGIEHVFNKRMWYSSSMLYTYDFLKSYATEIAPYFLAKIGKSRKVLVLDCDNTLWKGIIGEDGYNGISFKSGQQEGDYFEEVHYMLKYLKSQGVLLVLNSKNNFEDVKEFFDKYNDLPVKWDDFVLKKINWNDKVSNIKEIAQELNLGLDSIVHIDDSDFEINHINKEIPDVVTIQVPKILKEYPILIRKAFSLFLNLNKTKEDLVRSEFYSAEEFRKREKDQIKTLDEYLESLQLELSIKHNDIDNIERLAQLTQKTNQFNLTTLRYSDSEIQNFMIDENSDIFSFSLKDKFGEYGITGLCILKKQNSFCCEVDTFLMSCRIIGRMVEFAFFNFLIDLLKNSSYKTIKAKFLTTQKNSQVEDFYEKLGFRISNNEEAQKNYEMDIASYNSKNINYIKINYERGN
jgi:FkbH-like protein